MSLRPIIRISPTPSGYLHKGNCFNFILTALYAQKYHFDILLKIDDIDQERVRDTYLDHIFYALNELGIVWTLGPQTIAEHKAKYSQHLRMNHYLAYVEKLNILKHTFNCACSRKDLIKRQSNGIYDSHCLLKKIKKGKCRFNTDLLSRDFSKSTLNYFVVCNDDGVPSYQICSVVDDVFFNVDYAIRGNDLFDSSYLQLELLKKENKIIEYKHHKLLTKADKIKLSKSQEDGQMELDKIQIFNEFLEFFNVSSKKLNSVTQLYHYLEELNWDYAQFFSKK